MPRQIRRLLQVSNMPSDRPEALAMQSAPMRLFVLRKMHPGMAKEQQRLPQLQKLLQVHGRPQPLRAQHS